MRKTSSGVGWSGSARAGSGVKAGSRFRALPAAASLRLLRLLLRLRCFLLPVLIILAPKFGTEPSKSSKDRVGVVGAETFTSAPMSWRFSIPRRDKIDAARAPSRQKLIWLPHLAQHPAAVLILYPALAPRSLTKPLGGIGPSAHGERLIRSTQARA